MAETRAWDNWHCTTSPSKTDLTHQACTGDLKKPVGTVAACYYCILGLHLGRYRSCATSRVYCGWRHNLYR